MATTKQTSKCAKTSLGITGLILGITYCILCVVIFRFYLTLDNTYKSKNIYPIPNILKYVIATKNDIKKYHLNNKTDIIIAKAYENHRIYTDTNKTILKDIITDLFNDFFIYHVKKRNGLNRHDMLFISEYFVLNEIYEQQCMNSDNNDMNSFLILESDYVPQNNGDFNDLFADMYRLNIYDDYDFINLGGCSINCCKLYDTHSNQDNHLLYGNRFRFIDLKYKFIKLYCTQSILIKNCNALDKIRKLFYPLTNHNHSRNIDDLYLYFSQKEQLNGYAITPSMYVQNSTKFFECKWWCYYDDNVQHLKSKLIDDLNPNNDYFAPKLHDEFKKYFYYQFVTLKKQRKPVLYYYITDMLFVIDSHEMLYNIMQFMYGYKQKDFINLNATIIYHEYNDTVYNYVRNSLHLFNKWSDNPHNKLYIYNSYNITRIKNIYDKHKCVEASFTTQIRNNNDIKFNQIDHAIKILNADADNTTALSLNSFLILKPRHFDINKKRDKVNLLNDKLLNKFNRKYTQKGFERFDKWKYNDLK